MLIKCLEEGLEKKIERSWLFSHSSESISEKVFDKFQTLINKRLEGVPISYLTEVKEFYGYDFFVNRHTLIPRTETELLLEISLNILSKRNNSLIFDIGTGSGAIIIALVSELIKKNVFLSEFSFIASDIEKDALKVAKRNSKQYSLDSVINFFQCSLLESFSLINLTRLDRPVFLISNPPYIEFGDPLVESSVHNFEPHSALYSEDFGCFHNKTLIDNFVSLCKYSNSNVDLCIEIGFEQENELLSYFNKKASGDVPLSKNSMKGLSFESYKDASGIVRVLHFFN